MSWPIVIITVCLIESEWKVLQKARGLLCFVVLWFLLSGFLFVCLFALVFLGLVFVFILVLVLFFCSFQDNLVGKMNILLPKIVSYPLTYRLVKLSDTFCWWNKCLMVREWARGNINLNFTDLTKGYVLTYWLKCSRRKYMKMIGRKN